MTWSLSATKNILVYRLGSLGDTVLILPCFHLIRKLHPHSKIILLTNQPVSGKAAPAMAILENSGLCDEAISYPVGTRNTAELQNIRRIIRQLQPEVLYNLAASRGSLKSLRDYLFFRSCGVKKIIGTPWRHKDFHAAPIRGEVERESQRIAARLDSVGTIDLADRRLWDLRLTATELNVAAKLLPANEKGFIAVSMGTKSPLKDWGEDNWQKLLALLTDKMPGITLILLGSEDESERCEKLRSTWKGPSLNLSGKTTPRISSAVLKHCRLFIGHDSGPMHLAAATGVPTLGLFSWSSPPQLWFPGHQSWQMVKVLYPMLEDGVWHPGLQFKNGPDEGVQRLHPDFVSEAALQLWRDNVSPAESCGDGRPVQTVNR